MANTYRSYSAPHDTLYLTASVRKAACISLSLSGFFAAMKKMNSADEATAEKAAEISDEDDADSD
jgi:hypothetical protein